MCVCACVVCVCRGRVGRLISVDAKFKETVNEEIVNKEIVNKEMVNK